MENYDLLQQWFRLHGRYLSFGILSHALTCDSSRGEILRLPYNTYIHLIADQKKAAIANLNCVKQDSQDGAKNEQR